MDLAYVLMLLVSCLTFFGYVAADLENRLGDRKRWNLIGMNRVKRDLMTHLQLPNDAIAQPAFVRTEDAKDSVVPQSSNNIHIRVKRYRHSFSNYPQISFKGCNFGTCIVHKLANQIYQYTDKDKDSTAPARKISSQGYGRRRRSVPERKLLLPVVDGRVRPWWVSTRSSDAAAEQLLEVSGASMKKQGGVPKTKGKLWQTLLRT